MKENVLKRKDYLNLLATSKNKKRRDSLVNLASPEEIRAITEIVKNCLVGNVPLHADCLSKMKRHRKKLRLISQRRYPVKRKKTLIKQTGGILSALIPLGVSALSSLIGQLAK